MNVMLGYLGVRSLSFPYTLKLKEGASITIDDWNDLTTAWVVLFGNEYRIRPEYQTIVDLGSNIGMFILLAHSKSPNARIVAVEPFPANFERMVQCVATNGLKNQVQPRSYAISGSSGSFFMNAAPHIPSHSRHLEIEFVPEIRVEVEALSLADFLDREGLQEVDFLKMDIEGAEYDVLLQADVASLRRFKRIGLEYHDLGLSAIESHLAAANFVKIYHPRRGSSGAAEFERR